MGAFEEGFKSMGSIITAAHRSSAARASSAKSEAEAEKIRAEHEALKAGGYYDKVSEEDQAKIDELVAGNMKPKKAFKKIMGKDSVVGGYLRDTRKDKKLSQREKKAAIKSEITATKTSKLANKQAKAKFNALQSIGGFGALATVEVAKAKTTQEMLEQKAKEDKATHTEWLANKPTRDEKARLENEAKDEANQRIEYENDQFEKNEAHRIETARQDRVKKGHENTLLGIENDKARQGVKDAIIEGKEIEGAKEKLKNNHVILGLAITTGQDIIDSDQGDVEIQINDLIGALNTMKVPVGGDPKAIEAFTARRDNAIKALEHRLKEYAGRASTEVKRGVRTRAALTSMLVEAQLLDPTLRKQYDELDGPDKAEFDTYTWAQHKLSKANITNWNHVMADPKLRARIFQYKQASGDKKWHVDSEGKTMMETKDGYTRPIPNMILDVVNTRIALEAHIKQYEGYGKPGRVTETTTVGHASGLTRTPPSPIGIGPATPGEVVKLPTSETETTVDPKWPHGDPKLAYGKLDPPGVDIQTFANVLSKIGDSEADLAIYAQEQMSQVTEEERLRIIQARMEGMVIPPGVLTPPPVTPAPVPPAPVPPTAPTGTSALGYDKGSAEYEYEQALTFFGGEREIIAEIRDRKHALYERDRVLIKETKALEAEIPAMEKAIETAKAKANTAKVVYADRGGPNLAEPAQSKLLRDIDKAEGQVSDRESDLVEQQSKIENNKSEQKDVDRKEGISKEAGELDELAEAGVKVERIRFIKKYFSPAEIGVFEHKGKQVIKFSDEIPEKAASRLDALKIGHNYRKDERKKISPDKHISVEAKELGGPNLLEAIRTKGKVLAGWMRGNPEMAALVKKSELDPTDPSLSKAQADKAQKDKDRALAEISRRLKRANELKEAWEILEMVKQVKSSAAPSVEEAKKAGIIK